MKALLAGALLSISLVGCRANPQAGQMTEKSTSAPKAVSIAKAEPISDSSEVLIRHLLRRIQDLSGEVQKRQNETLEHDNKCLQEQIAVLEGRPVHHAKRDPAADARELARSLDAGIERVAENLLDGEAAIEDHNQKHPESPWADVKDV